MAPWWQSMGVPAPMSGFSIFFSLPSLTLPGLPGEHQENDCLERPLVATMLTAVTSITRIGVLDAKVTGKGHSEVQGLPLLWLPPTIFKPHVC